MIRFFELSFFSSFLFLFLSFLFALFASPIPFLNFMTPNSFFVPVFENILSRPLISTLNVCYVGKLYVEGYNSCAENADTCGKIPKIVTSSQGPQ